MTTPADKKSLARKGYSQDIEEVGLHLVPKKERFWHISVSNAGKTLMQSLNKADNGCRRWCHKLLKDNFKKWLGKTGHKLPGMSTMIFKRHLFWFNENNPHLN